MGTPISLDGFNQCLIPNTKICGLIEMIIGVNIWPILKYKDPYWCPMCLTFLLTNNGGPFKQGTIDIPPYSQENTTRVVIVWLANKGIFSWIGDVSQLRKNHWPCHRPGSWGLIGVYKVTSTTKLLITTFLLTYVLTFYLALFRAFYLTCILTYSFWHSICDLSGSLSGVRVQACHGVPSCIQSW